MKIMHISPHYGGGVGTVVGGLIKNDNYNAHRLYSLELCREKKVNSLFVQLDDLRDDMKCADIVLVHYWDNPLLGELFSKPIPDCRLAFWCHKNVPYIQRELRYPDIWIDTSPIQGHGKYIWSTGDMERFLAIKPKEHKGFNVGYVGTIDRKKIHPQFAHMCAEIKKRIPEARFTIVGGIGDIEISTLDGSMVFTGKVDDVAPYLAEMDVFGYPLRPDHYGTCEQALGEAMSAGVVPVVMDNPAEKIIVGEACARTEYEYVRMIEMLYQAPEFRQLLSDKVRQRAKELYSLDTMIQQWNDVFESMMQNPKTKRRPL